MERLVTEIKADPEQLAETVYCFLHPAAELRELLDAGRAGFTTAAMREVADHLHPVQFNQIQQQVAAHYANSFVTAISYDRPAPAGEVFTPPPPKRMVSVGGSNSSAS
jgi:hypothetical protein